MESTPESKALLTNKLPAGIWALGFVSLLMDASSEMIHALLPVYLVTAMGASVLTVGLIEGIAEATASITKVFSGAISDWLGHRKLLVVLGYGLAALTKPVFPLATSVSWLIGARFVDRIGKGIRGAPRDALIADLAPAQMAGAAFGLRQSMDTIGAFIGPALAILLMWITADNFHLVFWVAVIPAALCVLVIIFGIREPERDPVKKPVRMPLSKADLVRLGSSFWVITIVATFFTLARFSEAFLILKANDSGLLLALTPLVLVVMNVVYAATAYPAGILGDRMNKVSIIIVGIFVLIAADMVLATTNSLPGVTLGVILWGLHMGLTQGLFASLVAGTVPSELRGTGFGVFNMLGGVALLIASVMAGFLWDQFGSSATFYAGIIMATASLFGLLYVRRTMPALGAIATSTAS